MTQIICPWIADIVGYNIIHKCFYELFKFNTKYSIHDAKQVLKWCSSTQMDSLNIIKTPLFMTTIFLVTSNAIKIH
jgi:hypothetical protein